MEPHQLRKPVTKLAENKPKHQRKLKLRRQYQVLMVYYLVLHMNYNTALFFFNERKKTQRQATSEKITPSTELK